GQVWPGQLPPDRRAAFDEAGLLLSHLVFDALGDTLYVAADGGGVQGTAERQDLGEQLGRQPVGDKTGELGLQVDQLWRAPFRKQFGQRTEGPGLVWSASTVPPAG